MKQIKKVTHQETNRVVDEDGVVKSSETVTQSVISAEPPYIKLYITDLCEINHVPKSESNVLMHLVKKLDYDGFITISKRYRNMICEDLNIKPQTLSNKIHSLCKSGLITSVGSNEYETNPYFFGRGAWVDILNRRQKGSFSLKITYTSDGEKEYNTESELDPIELKVVSK